MELSLIQLELIIVKAGEIGAIAALIKAGELKPYLKKSEIFKRFGRSRVEHWIENGLVTIRKDGDFSAARRLDRIKLEVRSGALGVWYFINQQTQ
jgi:hypothetical protein